jgi:S-adenosylmethionine:tRNA ribosyltransferase-isomerase
METGEYLVRFSLPKDADPPALAQRIGKLPLPPYVQRPASKEDETRYQTVYANGENQSAVAAPTAGLHFTNKILNELKNSGHSIYDLSLSVGLGTFRPIETSKIEDHPMHAEEYFLPNETGQALFQKDQKRLAIGTTCVRAIEHFLSTTPTHPGRSVQAEANLFIRPPYEFLGVDHLLTNFHLPGSTLLCLVAAFLAPNKCHGLQKLKELYAEAISQKYRFFSYGDAMLII